MPLQRRILRPLRQGQHMALLRLNLVALLGSFRRGKRKPVMNKLRLCPWFYKICIEILMVVSSLVINCF